LLICKIYPQIGRRFGPFDLSAIPIGAYNPRSIMKFVHVNPEEAVKIHEDLVSILCVVICGQKIFGQIFFAKKNGQNFIKKLQICTNNCR
jgi:hypothetical protein